MRQVFRFFIGANGLTHSSAYTILVIKGEIYLFSKGLGGILKASFHGSGICSFGFTSDYWTNNFQGKRANSARWRREKIHAANRLERIAILRFQEDSLKARKKADHLSKYRCLQPAEKGRRLDVVLCISSHNITGREPLFSGAEIVWSAGLNLHEKLLVSLHRGDALENVGVALEKFNAPGPRLEWNWVSNLESGKTLTDLHAVLGTKPDDGQPILIYEISGMKFQKF